MPKFNRLPGESYLDYIWRNFGGKTVKGDGTVILSETATQELIVVQAEETKQEITTQVTLQIDLTVANQIQEKIVGSDSNTIILNVDEGAITANVKIDESESPVKLSVSDQGLKADLEIDTDSSVELSTSSGKLKADIPLIGTDVPITFSKISSEDYKALESYEIGRVYLLSDSPYFYLDGKMYGMDAKITNGFITNIRYDNGTLYYTVSGEESEKTITVDLASADKSGLLSNEDYVALHKVIESIADVEDVSTFVQDKIDSLTLSIDENVINLSLDGNVLGSVTLPKDIYVVSGKVTAVTLEELDEAKFADSTINLELGASALKLTLNDGTHIYIPVNDIVGSSTSNSFESSNTITFSKTASTANTAEVVINPSDKNFLSATTDGLLVDIPIATAPSDTSEGSTGLMTVDLAAALAELHPYTEGDGIEFGDSDTINIKLATGDQVLSFNTTGDLQTTLKLSYDSDKKLIELLGKDDEVIGEGIDASDFIKDGMITSVECTNSKPNGDGDPIEGSFLKITWNIDNDGDNANDVVYVDVADLVHAYVAGNGINIDSNTISIQLSDDAETIKYLTFKDSKLLFSGLDDVWTTINGLDEDNKIKTTYSKDNTIASKFEEVDKTVAELSEEVGKLTGGKKIITDVKVNDISVVPEGDSVAYIEMTAENTKYDDSTSVKDKIDLVNGDVSTVGSIRHDADNYVDNSWTWDEISNETQI